MQTKEFTVEFPELWRQVGDSIVSVHSRIDERFDRVDARLDGIDARLDRMELANERRFNRIDAQIERLVAHVIRDETNSP
jgi:hypothetical protein